MKESDKKDIELYRQIISEIMSLKDNYAYDEFDDGFNVALRMVKDIINKYGVYSE